MSENETARGETGSSETEPGGLGRIVLRYYQEEDVENILDSLDDDLRTFYQLATGGGKTEIMLAVAARMLQSEAPGVVQLVHLKELVGQVCQRARDAGLPVHCTYDDPKGQYLPGHYNIQSVERRPANRRQQDGRCSSTRGTMPPRRAGQSSSWPTTD